MKESKNLILKQNTILMLMMLSEQCEIVNLYLTPFLCLINMFDHYICQIYGIFSSIFYVQEAIFINKYINK